MTDEDGSQPVEIPVALQVLFEPAKEAREKFEREHPELLGKYIVLRIDTGAFSTHDSERAMRVEAARLLESLPRRERGSLVGRVMWFRAGMSMPSYKGEVN